ncbi:hypothetical protein [Leptolyngbya iicbica]|uniref:hypothetical protein n=1 Tax=Leptolyngbya iicbica TaxID=3161580 RepID=UPI0013EEA703|nr:hypothetical protein [Leptolyngbya sp. LK]
MNYRPGLAGKQSVRGMITRGDRPQPAPQTALYIYGCPDRGCNLPDQRDRSMPHQS